MGKVTYFNQPSEDKISKIYEETQKALEEKKWKEKLRRKIRKSIFPWIICGILFLVGIGFLAYSGIREEFRHNNWIATSAIVVNQQTTQAHVKDKNGNTKIVTYYHAIFKYTFDGKEYSVADSTGATNPVYRVGDTATIYVNPDNPKDIESNQSSQFFYIFGTILSVIAFMALCFTTAPVLSAAYPNADWPKYVGYFLPTLIFMLMIVAISAIMIKPHSVLNIGALGIFIAALVITVFLAVLMGKEIVDNAKRNKRNANAIAKIDETLKDLEEFRRQNAEFFDNSKNTDDSN